MIEGIASIGKLTPVQEEWLTQGIDAHDVLVYREYRSLPNDYAYTLIFMTNKYGRLRVDFSVTEEEMYSLSLLGGEQLEKVVSLIARTHIRAELERQYKRSLEEL